MEEVLKVGLEYEGQIYDIQFSARLSLATLKKPLRTALATHGVELPAEFELVLVNKALELDEHKQLALYPVGNGDQFKILTDEVTK